MFFNKWNNRTCRTVFWLYPIGKKFEYLGREMIVAATASKRSGRQPVIIAEYVDICGEIQEYTFIEDQFPHLIEMAEEGK
jgi:hypothetical protein